jgi:hypothetical protein
VHHLSRRTDPHWYNRRFHSGEPDPTTTEESTMRMMLTASIPHEPFNTLVREGKAGTIIGRILDELKPEAVYFMEQNGRRCAVLIINFNDTSKIPSFAEPFFLNFNADVRFRPVMAPEDLGKAGLEDLGRKWK